MSHKMSDLNAALFAQLDRVSNPELSPEALEQEVERTNAIVSVADQITGNYDLQLKAAKLFAEHGQSVLPHLPMIGKDAS